MKSEFLAFGLRAAVKLAVCCLVISAFPVNDASATTVHIPLPTTNNLFYSTQVTLVGTPTDIMPFVSVGFTLPGYMPTDPYWAVTFGPDVMGGSNEAYRIYVQGPASPINRDSSRNGFYIPTLLPLVLTVSSIASYEGVVLTDSNFSLDLFLPDGVTATPLPATLPLFATGLGALSLLRWRRKRKVAV